LKTRENINKERKIFLFELCDIEEIGRDHIERLSIEKGSVGLVYESILTINEFNEFEVEWEL